MTVHRFGVNPSEIMTSRETQEYSRRKTKLYGRVLVTCFGLANQIDLAVLI